MNTWRTFLLITGLLTFGFSFAQDTSVTWINNIDTTTFKIFYSRKSIPKDFYKIIGISKRGDIVSAHKAYQKGCVNRGRASKRLNWLAKDNNNHWVLSISYGGRASGTKYIYIDCNKDGLNINGFYFTGGHHNNYSLGQTITKLKEGQFYRMDFSSFDNEEEKEN